MSATDQMRQMLRELMGSAAVDESQKDLHFTDPRVCRSFLIGCCPHEVLASTRMDLGDCRSIHDVALRADYEKDTKAGKDYFYDLDALDQLERFFEDCDRKTEIAKKRLEETQEEVSTEIQEKADKVLEINEEIGKTLAEAERLGSEGKVDESLKLMEKVEELRKTKQDADTEYRGSMPQASYQQQKLRVCEVCSAYLGIHDNDRRLADHFGGKLHMGFVFLREKLAEMRAASVDRRAARTARGRSRERDDRRGSSSRYDDRDRRYDRYEDERERRRRRSGSRERSRSSRKRSRSRDRERRSTRSRDRERRSTRSRDRDRERRSARSRDRDREHKKRKREKRSRSRSRSKTSKSPSKEKSLESGEHAESNGKGVDTRLSDVDD